MNANRTARQMMPQVSPKETSAPTSSSPARRSFSKGGSSPPPAPGGHPLRYSQTPGSHLTNRRAEFHEAPSGEASPGFGDSREFVPPGAKVYEMSSTVSPPPAPTAIQAYSRLFKLIQPY
jgi:hypothetical protein